MKETSWGQHSVDRELWEIAGSGQPTGSVQKETIAVSVTISISVENDTVKSISEFFQAAEWEKASRTRSPRGWSPSRMSRWPSKDNLKGICTNKFCEKWRPPECLFYKSENECRFGEKSSYTYWQIDEQPSKKPKKNDDKSAVAMLKKHEMHDRTEQPVVDRDTRHEHHGPLVCKSSSTRQLGCVFQDMEPPKLSSILRKSTDMPKPIQRVKFTKVVARHTKIRDQNPSLGKNCPGEPHQRGPQRSKIWGSISGRHRMARARCPRSSVEAGQQCIRMKAYKRKQQSSHLRKIGACLHQILNLRNENLLWSPERRCIWSAKRTWMTLKWIPWRNRVVLR